MRGALPAVIGIGLLAMACRSQIIPVSPSSASSSAPSPTPPASSPNGNLSGAWTGTGSDSFSPEHITWKLAQSESTITGTAEFAPVDPGDGSCASCHKLRKGTLTGTLAGTTLTIRMEFPPGGDVPTPVCSTSLAAIATLAGDQISGTYSGTDSCEGFYAGGQLSLTRQP